MQTTFSVNDLRSIFNEVIFKIEESLEQIKLMRFNRRLKDDNSPVTDADIFLQDMIISLISKKIKGIKFISEELKQSFDSPILGEYYAILDPIDGTENFTSGLPIWGVAISIWKYPEHLASLIYLPELKRHIMTGDSVHYLSSRIIAFSSSLDDFTIDQILSKNENRITGCSAFNFYNVILGSFNVLINRKGASIWDLLPGLNLAKEHGCFVMCEGELYKGEFLNPNKKYSFEIRQESNNHTW